MASGNPVIGTDVGGMSEIVKDGETGYLVEAADPKALADKVIELLLNNDLRAEMGQRGRQVAEEKFSLETMIDNYHKLYEELLN
jgi:glycosyltransferase involved in cell wall biosynthesis